MPMTRPGHRRAGPRVAWAQRDVGLEPVPGARSFERGGLSGGDDDAGGRRTAQSRRVTDRNGDLTGSYGAGIAEAGGGQTIGGDLDDRQITVGVAGGDDAGELATVVEDDVDAIVPDDVTVGDDDTVGAPDDTGAVAAALTDEDDRRFRSPPRCRRSRRRAPARRGLARQET